MSARIELFSLVLGLALALPGAALAQIRGTGSNGGAIPAKPAPNPLQSQAAKAPAAPANFNAHDLSGIWNMSFPANATEAELEVYVSQFGKGEPPMTAWAKERFDKTKPAFGARGVLVAQTNDPAFQCYPPGVPRIYLHPFPMQIVATPKELIMLFEYDHNVRHIYTDGRQHPQDLTPTYMGHSIGHWDGDTFVIDSVGFNDKTWLDRAGHPHSDQLHVTERLRRIAADRLQIDFTIEDPVAYTQAFTSSMFFRLHADWSLMEQVCEDNAAFLSFEK
jgi:hypothetical protein